LEGHFHSKTAEEFSKVMKLLGPPAPECPKCGKSLDRVDVERYPDSLRWDNEKRAYVFSKLVPVATYICPNCKEVIGKQYANGDKFGFDPANVVEQQPVKP